MDILFKNYQMYSCFFIYYIFILKKEYSSININSIYMPINI